MASRRGQLAFDTTRSNRPTRPTEVDGSEIAELAPEMLAELVPIFVRLAPRRLDAISTAITRRDVSALASAAHALKSEVAMFGAAACVRLCANIERLARAGNLPAATDLSRELGLEVGRAMARLQHLVAGKQ